MSDVSPQATPQAIANAESQAQRPARDAKTIYRAHCAACHQADGRGLPPTFPSLVGSPLAKQGPSAIKSLIKNGRGLMPKQLAADLSEAEQDLVAEYVISTFAIQ